MNETTRTSLQATEKNKQGLPFLDTLFQLTQWVCLAGAGASFVLVLVRWWMGIELYWLWLMVDDQGPLWSLVLLLGILALSCWLSRKARGRQFYSVLGLVCVALLIGTITSMSLMYSWANSMRVHQSVSLDRHLYHLASEYFITPEEDRQTLHLAQCDETGLFCHEITFPAHVPIGFHYDEDEPSGRFALRVDTQKHVLIVIADHQAIFTYHPVSIPE